MRGFDARPADHTVIAQGFQCYDIHLMVDVILVTTEEGVGKGDRELVGDGG